MPSAPIFDQDPPLRPAAPTVVVHAQSGGWRSWAIRLLVFGLALSLLVNFSLFAAYREYFTNVEAPIEKYHSGSETARDKIAVLKMSGTIMPPFTERLVKQIKHAAKTDSVKGVLLVVDSPGGYVGDSHEIYYQLLKVSEKKPVYVYMSGMAASGGYYISMGAGPQGKIFAEPTVWTGSIGVIIPRYDVSELATKWGVNVDPLKTGEFKDALSPFRPLTERERKLWENILTQAFDQFIEVIDENRDNLTEEQVKALATGQIYTAKDALANGLIDEIGYEDDALTQLKDRLKTDGKITDVEQVRVVTYEHPATLTDLLLGSAKTQSPKDAVRSLLEASVPRSLYYCSWLPPLPD